MPLWAVVPILLIATASAQTPHVPVEGPDRLTLGGRVYALWTLTDEPTGPQHDFEISRARLSMRLARPRTYAAELEIDFEGLLGDGSNKVELADAWLRWDALPQLRIRAGQMKRPFGRLWLTPRRRMPTIRRGLAHKHVLKTLGHGGRDIGLLLDGRAGTKDRRIEYAIGIFNGTGPNATELDMDGSKDIVVRVAGRPLRRLDLGVSASIRFCDDSAAGCSGTAWATGLDVRARPAKGVSIVAEATLTENHEAEDRPVAWSTALVTRWKIHQLDLGAVLFEPFFHAELLDPGLEAGQVIGLQPGLNIHFWNRIRLMIQGDVTLPADDPVLEDEWPERLRFMVQAAIDI